LATHAAGYLVDRQFAVHASVRETDSAYARDLALRGVGIAYLFEPLVREDLQAGRLQRVLPATSIEKPSALRV
jgi:DNA-binding transcriptional LysR family regulator